MSIGYRCQTTSVSHLTTPESIQLTLVIQWTILTNSCIFTDDSDRPQNVTTML